MGKLSNLAVVIDERISNSSDQFFMQEFLLFDRNQQISYINGSTLVNKQVSFGVGSRTPNMIKSTFIAMKMFMRVDDLFLEQKTMTKCRSLVRTSCPVTSRSPRLATMPASNSLSVLQEQHTTEFTTRRECPMTGLFQARATTIRLRRPFHKIAINRSRCWDASLQNVSTSFLVFCKLNSFHTLSNSSHRSES